MILDNPLSLLFIEPKTPKKLNRSNASKYRWFKQELERSAFGTHTEGLNKFEIGKSYLGRHTCVCGEMSDAHDILLPNKMVTNSLSYHYLVQHADEIPEMELFKLSQLKSYLERAVNPAEGLGEEVFRLKHTQGS